LFKKSEKNKANTRPVILTLSPYSSLAKVGDKPNGHPPVEALVQDRPGLNGHDKTMIN
jgi:hypothetical protein